MKKILIFTLVIMLVGIVCCSSALAADGPWKCVYCNVINRANYCTSCGRSKSQATSRPTKIAVVTNLKTGKITDKTIEISWTGSKNADHYAIEYKKSSDSKWTPATSNCKETKYTLTGLTAYTKYDIHVRAAKGNNYSDYATLKKVRTEKDAKVKVGSYVKFGHYPQTAAGNDNTEIEWLVLAVSGKKALLLSKYGLDAQPYNTTYTDVTWETCTLRKWLNGTFKNKAFSKTEQGAIYTTKVDNSKSQGNYDEFTTGGSNSTKDKIFLLSYAETKRYLDVIGSSATQIRVAPTAYAIKQGAYSSSKYMTVDGKAAGYWWLRSPGPSNAAEGVDKSGWLCYCYSVNFNNFAVRPALWVNLESGIY